MKNGWVKITVSLMLIAATGVGVWAVIDKLDPSTFKVIVGVVLTLTIVVVVGGLFIGKDLLQAYIIRRAIAQDDLSDMRQMAFIARLMGGRGNTTVKIPDRMGQASNPFMLPGATPQQPSTFDGTYRDTTVSSEIEIE